MDLNSFILDFGFQMLLFLFIFAFIAGFIDAVIGGGGLIQLPALLINLPLLSIPTLFGTNKIAALSGTVVAAYHYTRKVKYNFLLLLSIAFFAFVASFFGAKLLNHLDVILLKPLILVILILIAIYTFLKKDLGKVQTITISLRSQYIYGSIIGLVVGFYDGFFGPGTGSFFVLGFVVILGMEFVVASAYSKVINSFTNISALIVFISQGNYILELATFMAMGNVFGSIVGSKMAIKKGNGFIRIIFLIVVSLMILRYTYDLFMVYF